MSAKQDATGIRSWQDVERRLLGLTKNQETSSKTLLKINNELNNIISSLIINLKDAINNQSEVSLWFYSGEPTVTNEPYISWSNPSEHYEDIYYDKLTGYVYQYKSDGWNINNDSNLIQAMALTNIEVDISEDSERKVFLSFPLPPYSSGDWWIKDDGALFICQIGKNSGQYEENDFIVSSQYTANIAIKENEKITVLKGTVREITENYVKYTDLATGGSTTIAGDNITTGIINASLIKAGTMNLQRLFGGDLTLGGNNNISGRMIIKDSNAVEKIIADADGLRLINGAKLFGSDGILSAFQYKSGTTGNFLGFYWECEEYKKSRLILDICIPDNFVISNAKVTLMHRPIYWNYADANLNTNYAWGWSRNIKMYKVTSLNRILQATMFGGDIYESYFEDLAEISNAFGSNSYTPTTPSSTNYKTEIKESIDIKNYLNKGRTVIVIQTANAIPPAGTVLAPNPEGYKQTGDAEAVLNIIGYMK